MDIYMDNYGYMRRRKTGKIYDWQVKAQNIVLNNHNTIK